MYADDVETFASADEDNGDLEWHDTLEKFLAYFELRD